MWRLSSTVRLALIAWRQQRARRRQRIRTEATALAARQGAMAYRVARDRSRAARNNGKGAEARFWSKVAVEIARSEGWQDEIGGSGADRYPGV